MSSTSSEHDIIRSILASVRTEDDCEVRPPAGLPGVRLGHALPEDLRAFYVECGGLTLFGSAEFPCRIVSPEEFAPSNPQIIDAEAPEDLTDSWYIVARGESSEAISIDLGRERAGRCYDSFWDRHGIRGSCAVIAVSFSDLLARLVASRGRHWYWHEPEFASLGDAYDPV